MISLLITVRIRHVPPSGANVSPVRRTFWISAAVPTVNASTRSDGRLTETRPSWSGSSTMSRTVSSIPEKSADRQRGQRHLVVPAPLEPAADHVAHLRRRALAHGPGDHAGLAEAAAAGAAAEDLDVEPVVHHLGQRHERARAGRASRPGRRTVRLATSAGHAGVAGRVATRRPSAYSRRVERRHVDALDRGQRAPAARPVAPLGHGRRQPGPDGLGDLADDLLPVAEHEGVDEVGQRLGVEGAVAAGDHQGVVGARGPRRAAGGPARSIRLTTLV